MSKENEMLQGPVDEGTTMSRRSVLEGSLGVAFAGAVLGGLGVVADLTAAEPQSANADQPTIRVVITGNNAEGKSYFVSDKRYPRGGATPNLFKTRAEGPLGEGGAGDPQKVLETAPATDQIRNINPPMGGVNLLWSAGQAAGPDYKPLWHRTETVDYRIQISGQAECMLDEGKTTLGPGDIIIMRNTNHAWRSITANTMVTVLVRLP
jgi:hypothetical protein